MEMRSTKSENANDTLIHRKDTAKLTGDIVKEMSATKDKDGLTQIKRTEKYGVSTNTMRDVGKYREYVNLSYRNYWFFSSCEESPSQVST